MSDNIHDHLAWLGAYRCEIEAVARGLHKQQRTDAADVLFGIADKMNGRIAAIREVLGLPPAHGTGS